MILIEDSFWRVDVGRLLECVVFGSTWLISKAMDSQKKSDKVDEHTQWIVEHKKEDEKRDETLDRVSRSIEVLTALQKNVKESHEYRLEHLEIDVKDLRRA